MIHAQAKASAIVGTSVLMLTFVPRLFAVSHVDVSVTGNGAGSTQNVTVETASHETIQQSNTTVVMSVQTAKSSTGGNSITGSTGNGDNAIVTGHADAENMLSVTSGSNAVMNQPCGCQPSQVVVDVSGNGANSKTTVTTKNTSRRSVRQMTQTEVYTDQYTKSKTGKNTIKNSTGKGSNTIETGNSTTNNTVVVESGSNLLGPSL